MSDDNTESVAETSLKQQPPINCRSQLQLSWAAAIPIDCPEEKKALEALFGDRAL